MIAFTPVACYNHNEGASGRKGKVDSFSLISAECFWVYIRFSTSLPLSKPPLTWWVGVMSPIPPPETKNLIPKCPVIITIVSVYVPSIQRSKSKPPVILETICPPPPSMMFYPFSLSPFLHRIVGGAAEHDGHQGTHGPVPSQITKKDITDQGVTFVTNKKQVISNKRCITRIE